MTGPLFDNHYFTLAYLREHDAPADVIALAENYDPEREAVVTIQYSEDEEPEEPEVVTLDDEPFQFEQIKTH